VRNSRIEDIPVPLSPGESHPIPKHIALKQHPSSEDSNAWQRSLNHVTFRTFIRNFDQAPGLPASVLPAPLAYARLDSKLSFISIPPDSRKGFGEQVDPISIQNHILVKTNFGVRWISLSLTGQGSERIVPEM
jgi:hypothetical protein